MNEVVLMYAYDGGSEKHNLIVRMSSDEQNMKFARLSILPFVDVNNNDCHEIEQD